MSRAFTLIEMLVTVSIIAIITTFTVVNVGFQREERKVAGEARKFYGTLVYAKNLSVSGKVFKDENVDGAPDVPNGYGTYFVAFWSSSSGSIYTYYLYGDLYTGATAKRFDTGEELGVKEVVAKGVAVSFYLDTVLVPLVLTETIFFVTPRGDITYYNYLTDVSLNNPPVSEIAIEFASIKDPTIKDRVVINRVSGQIYVNEDP